MNFLYREKLIFQVLTLVLKISRIAVIDLDCGKIFSALSGVKMERWIFYGKAWRISRWYAG